MQATKVCIQREQRRLHTGPGVKALVARARAEEAPAHLRRALAAQPRAFLTYMPSPGAEGK